MGVSSPITPRRPQAAHLCSKESGLLSAFGFSRIFQSSLLLALIWAQSFSTPCWFQGKVKRGSQQEHFNFLLVFPELGEMIKQRGVGMEPKVHRLLQIGIIHAQLSFKRSGRITAGCCSWKRKLRSLHPWYLPVSSAAGLQNGWRHCSHWFLGSHPPHEGSLAE